MTQNENTMVFDLTNMNYTHGFNVDTWLIENTPKQLRSSTFWDEVHLEYNEVVQEFRTLLETKEQVIDKKGNLLTPLNLYILINEYKMRIEKLMLIFNIRLYKTENENKKTGKKYIVMRAFWIDHLGKKVRWFSKNIGPKDNVLVNGNIPTHLFDDVEQYILYVMWDQYGIEYLGWDQITSWDADGNNIVVE